MAPSADVEITEQQVEAAEPEVQTEPQPERQEDEQPLLPVVIPEPEQRLALLEGIIYAAEEPVTIEQLVEGLEIPKGVLEADLAKLVESMSRAERGIEIRKVAGGYKMFTKVEHHETVRKFVKTLRPKLRLSPPALETLAVIAYRQPVTMPEIQAVRGVNASGVIHTLLKHKLVATAGRKKVIGKPMLYKTTREFLVQFGLDDVSELPNLKELEELSRAAFDDEVEETEESDQTVEDQQLPLSESAVDEAVAEARREQAEQEEQDDPDDPDQVEHVEEQEEVAES